MRTAVLALMICTSPVMSSCATVGLGDAQEQVVLGGTKALITAEYAYNSVGSLVLALLRSGKIKGSDATKVRELNRKATKLLIDAKAAKTEAEKAGIARDLTSIITDLDAVKTKATVAEAGR